MNNFDDFIKTVDYERLVTALSEATIEQLKDVPFNQEIAAVIAQMTVTTSLDLLNDYHRWCSEEHHKQHYKQRS